MTNTYTKGILLVLATALISGFAIFINSFGVKETDSSLFTGLKNLVVAVLLFLTVILYQKSAFKNLGAKNWLKLAIIGLVGGSIPFLLFFKGLQITSGIQGSFIHKTLFIYVFVLAYFFLKEKINFRLLFGGLLLLFGNVIFLKMFSFKVSAGDLLVLIATMLWAIENVISKHTLKNLSGSVVAFGRMFFGLIFIFIFLIATGKIGLIASLTIPQIGWILISSVILYGYVMTYYNGLKLIPVSLAASILLLGAPITTILSFIFLGNQIIGFQILGGILIGAGIFLAIWWGLKIKDRIEIKEATERRE